MPDLSGLEEGDQWSVTRPDGQIVHYRIPEGNGNKSVDISVVGTDGGLLGSMRAAMNEQGGGFQEWIDVVDGSSIYLGQDTTYTNPYAGVYNPGTSTTGTPDSTKAYLPDFQQSFPLTENGEVVGQLGLVPSPYGFPDSYRNVYQDKDGNLSVWQNRSTESGGMVSWQVGQQNSDGSGWQNLPTGTSGSPERWEITADSPLMSRTEESRVGVHVQTLDPKTGAYTDRFTSDISPELGYTIFRDSRGTTARVGNNGSIVVIDKEGDTLLNRPAPERVYPDNRSNWEKAWDYAGNSAQSVVDGTLSLLGQNSNTYGDATLSSDEAEALNQKDALASAAGMSLALSFGLAVMVIDGYDATFGGGLNEDAAYTPMDNALGTLNMLSQLTIGADWENFGAQPGQTLSDAILGAALLFAPKVPRALGDGRTPQPPRSMRDTIDGLGSGLGSHPLPATGYPQGNLPWAAPNRGFELRDGSVGTGTLGGTTHAPGGNSPNVPTAISPETKPTPQNPGPPPLPAGLLDSDNLEREPRSGTASETNMRPDPGLIPEPPPGVFAPPPGPNEFPIPLPGVLAPPVGPSEFSEPPPGVFVPWARPDEVPGVSPLPAPVLPGVLDPDRVLPDWVPDPDRLLPGLIPDQPLPGGMRDPDLQVPGLPELDGILPGLIPDLVPEIWLGLAPRKSPNPGTPGDLVLQIDDMYQNQGMGESEILAAMGGKGLTDDQIRAVIAASDHWPGLLKDGQRMGDSGKIFDSRGNPPAEDLPGGTHPTTVAPERPPSAAEQRKLGIDTAPTESQRSGMRELPVGKKWRMPDFGDTGNTGAVGGEIGEALTRAKLLDDGYKIIAGGRDARIPVPDKSGKYFEPDFIVVKDGKVYFIESKWGEGQYTNGQMQAYEFYRQGEPGLQYDLEKNPYLADLFKDKAELDIEKVHISGVQTIRFNRDWEPTDELVWKAASSPWLEGFTNKDGTWGQSLLAYAELNAEAARRAAAANNLPAYLYFRARADALDAVQTMTPDNSQVQSFLAGAVDTFSQRTAALLGGPLMGSGDVMKSLGIELPPNSGVAPHLPGAPISAVGRIPKPIVDRPTVKTVDQSLIIQISRPRATHTVSQRMEQWRLMELVGRR